VAETLEQQGLAPLPAAVRDHLAGCPDCRNLVDDFNSILLATRQLPAEVEPPPRVWLSLRAQLVAEGLIRDAAGEHAAPSVPPVRSHWWEGFAGLLQGRALATAAVGLLIFAAAVMQLERSSAPPAHPTQSPVAAQSPSAQDPLDVSGSTLNSQETELHSAQTVGTISSSPVDDDLQKDLQTLNAFIAECQHHLKANPHDQLAREYLAGALQQKAELLAEMMDRGRSVN
jgi:hypothetical protein